MSDRPYDVNDSAGGQGASATGPEPSRTAELYSMN